MWWYGFGIKLGMMLFVMMCVMVWAICCVMFSNRVVIVCACVDDAFGVDLGKDYAIVLVMSLVISLVIRLVMMFVIILVIYAVTICVLFVVMMLAMCLIAMSLIKLVMNLVSIYGLIVLICL